MLEKDPALAAEGGRRSPPCKSLPFPPFAAKPGGKGWDTTAFSCSEIRMKMTPSCIALRCWYAHAEGKGRATRPEACVASESYYRRWWLRFRKDATPWARDNILWGIIVLVVPPLAVYIRDPHVNIDWGVIRAALWLYGASFLLYVAVHACRVPKKLDDEREAAEKFLMAGIGESKETIRQLTSTPKRTPAEQHDYEIARKAIQLLGEKGLVALRHLRRIGTMTISGVGVAGGSALPPGLNLNDTLWVYNHCHSEGLLVCNANLGLGERTFSISSKMEKVIDEVLYEGSTSAG